MRGVVNGKEAAIGMYGCHNREPFKPTVVMQDGWTEDGRKVMVEKPFTMTMDCGYAKHGYAKDDDRCNNCKWRKA